MDPTQNILLFIIVVLSILLLILGVQAFFILKDIGKTIGKANKVLDDAGSITQNFSGVSLLVTVLKSLLGKRGNDFLKISSGKKKPRREKSFEIKVSKNGEEVKKPIRRFFKGIKRFS